MTVAHAIRTSLAVGFTIAVGTILGFVLLVLGFQLGLFAGLEILFYRGLCLIALAMPPTCAALYLGLVRWRGPDLALRDAISATIVSAALNVSFLVVVPVTVDRSISIFILGQMADRPEEMVTADAMSARFTRLYVGEGRQIERRLREQSLSGNVAPAGDGYRITARGRAVVAISRVVAELFDSHAGILPPTPAEHR